MPMSPKERMQVYRKRLKGILPPSPLRMSAAKKVLKERQRAKLAALSVDETASGDAEDLGQKAEDGDREMKTRNEQQSPKASTTDRPFIAVIKSNDSKVSESGSSEESDEESEPVNKASGSESNKYALPSPYKNLPSVSVCLKEEDRLLAQRELGRSLLRTSPSSSNGGNDVNKSSRVLKIPPTLKKKRAEKPSPQVTGRTNDCYCWVCHRENISLVCIGCPRAFHNKCAGENVLYPTNWVCPECNKILHAEAVDTQSSVLSEISLDKLCSLLKFSLYKMKQRGGAPFHQPVSFEHFPMYPHYVIHPMDFSLLEKNIKQKLYGSTEAFLSDVKWILHNSCVFNGAQHPLSNNAKSVVKNCENDMQEIEICPDCFMHGANRNNKYWFSEVCGKPHPLVWAKLKGFPYWPAKVVRIVDGNVDARFFGAHDRAWVPVNQCYHLSKETPTSSKPKKKGNYEVALAELNVHVHLLIQKFGTFEYAPYRQVFDPTNKKHMFHGIDIDKISKEEIPVESTSVVTSEMCSSPMDPGKTPECKTFQDSAETFPKASEAESGIASLEHKEMDSSINMQRKSSVVDLTDSKDKYDSGNMPSPPGKANYDSSGLNKIQKVLEKIKGIVSNNDDEEEIEEANEKDDADNHQESLEEHKTAINETKSDSTNETNIKNSETSIIAGLIKSKPLPLMDIITEDIPEEPPVSILNTSNRNDLFSLKLNETIESCKAKLGISEVNDSMDIDSEDDDDEEEDEDDEDEEMEQDSEEEDGTEKKEDSGSEQSGEESSEESDADQSDSASSNTDIEEVSAYVKDSEKSEGHPISVENNNSNSSEKESEKSKESLKDSQERDISESKELGTDKSLDHQTENNSSPGKHDVREENRINKEVETDEDEHMSDNNESESASNSNGSRTDMVLPQEKVDCDKSSMDSKEQNNKPIKEEISENAPTTSSTKANESEEDDDIFICDPPPKPPTPPLICLDDGTDETEPEAEENVVDERRKAEELLKKEEDYIRKHFMAAVSGKPMAKNARKSIRRVVRPATPVSSEDEEEEEGEVTPSRVAKRTFSNRPSGAPAAKKAKPNENQLPPSRVETSKDAVVGDTDEDEDVDMEGGPSKKNTNRLSEPDQVVTEGVFPNATTSQTSGDPDAMLQKVKKRLLHVYAAYKVQRWKFMQEKAEMRHNMNLSLMEMRSSLEAEKRHALDAQSETLTLEKTKCVEEAKKKQWCASCLQESRYACCWNTSYCTITCQKKHFPIHRKTCTQIKLKNIVNKGTEVCATEGKKVVLLNMVPKLDANKPGTSANQPNVHIPLTKVIAQKPTQLSSSVSPSSIQFVSISSTQQSKPASVKKKITNSTEDTETIEDDSCTTAPVECVLEEKKELSLEERYFPSPPTVSFEGLDSALPDESVCFDDLVQEASDASDTEAAVKIGDSSPEEDFEFSDDDKNADNELVSLGHGVEVKAKFLNKCLIFGKTAKKLTRCLVDVIFPDTKLLANCSAFGNKSNLTKLTRAALPSRKVACIIDYVKKRFIDATKSEIVMAINLKCKEARAIIGKSTTEGKKPVVRRLLAKEQELEASASSTKTVKTIPVPKVKLAPPSKAQKPTTSVNKTSSTATVTTTAPATVLRQPPNIVCVQNPSNNTISPLLQQKAIRTGLMQLRLPMSSAVTLPRNPAPSILSKTVFKMPPKTRPETIRSILTRAQPGGNNILLPVHFIQQKQPKTTDAAGSQRPCIIMGTRSAETTPQTTSPNSQKPSTSTAKQE